jgi:two-component system sensor histidine kinase KdpD
VRLDAVMMEQVLVNLLENVVRHTPAGSGVEIAGRKSADGMWVELSVADHGPGVPPGEEAKVFEKFYRAPHQRERAQSGVGLGLTICKAIVQGHGGRIELRNRPAGGAEVTVSLPIETSPPVPEPESEMAKVS